MARFIDLTNTVFGVSIPAQQAKARERFLDILADSVLHIQNPGEWPLSGKRLVIGVATFSQHDMRMLDRIELLVAGIDPTRFSVSVFALNSCQSPDDVRQFIPTILDGTHSPAVGLWVDGQLVKTAWGYHGRELVETIILAESQLAKSSLLRQPVAV